MKILTWVDQKIKTWTVWDIGILKILCVLVGMILGAHVASFVFRFMTGFILISALLMIVLLARVFFTNTGTGQTPPKE